MAIEAGGLGHMGLRVTDAARSATFYRDVLGFQMLRETEGHALFNVYGVVIAVRSGSPETMPGDSFNPFRVGLDHIALAVPSADLLPAMQASLDSAGVRNNGVEQDPMTGATYIAFYDPDGIAWELYAARRS